jgi:hypothetical protein
VADGCYSGGFVSLSSKNTCVVTSAPQKAVGYSGTAKFWKLIKEKRVKKLSDIKKTSSEDTFAIRTASQTGLYQKCEKIRKYLIDNKVDLLDFENMIKVRNSLFPYYCERNKSMALPLINLAIEPIIELKAIFEKLEAINFKIASCAISDPELCKKMKSFLNAGTGFMQMKNLTELQTRALHIRTLYFNELISAAKPLSMEEIFIKSKSPKFKKLPLDRQKAIIEYEERVKAAEKKLDDASSPIYDEIQSVLKNKKSFQVIAELWPCFTATKRESEYWDNIADTYPDKLLSDSAIRDAKKCESKFSF